MGEEQNDGWKRHTTQDIKWDTNFSFQKLSKKLRFVWRQQCFKIQNGVNFCVCHEKIIRCAISIFWYAAVFDVQRRRMLTYNGTPGRETEKIVNFGMQIEGRAFNGEKKVVKFLSKHSGRCTMVGGSWLMHTWTEWCWKYAFGMRMHDREIFHGENLKQMSQRRFWGSSILRVWLLNLTTRSHNTMRVRLWCSEWKIGNAG